jgi:hypothetical protein
MIEMTEALAQRIYAVLAEHAGATDYWRADFVYRVNHGCEEYRFQGRLGFGGKFRCYRDRWYVDCYPEDVTPERMEMINKTNDALKTVREDVGAT